VKRVFILLPMMLPKLSDRAAAELLDILEQLLASVRHHYAPQAHRWQRSRCSAAAARRPASPTLFDDQPF
jgi:hypothetical protein